MRLRLVREDGSSARIEDLVDDWPMIEIDGVEARVCDVRGPGPLIQARAAGENGAMVISLTYKNEYMGRVARDPREHIWRCPFARRKIERCWLSTTIERRARERTMNLWPDAKP